MDHFNCQVFSDANKFLLYNGSPKPVSDIKPGDTLVGCDGLPRVVDKMVKQEYENFIGFRNYANYKMVLVCLSTDVFDLLCELVPDIEYNEYYIYMTVTEFIKLPKKISKHLFEIKSPLEYRLKQNNMLYIDPTILGYWLGFNKSSTCSPSSIKTLLQFEKNMLDILKKEYSTSLKYEINGKFIEYFNMYNTLLPLDYLYAGYPVRAKLFSGLIEGISDWSKENGYGNKLVINSILEPYCNEIVFLAASLNHEVTIKTMPTYMGFSEVKVLDIVLSKEYFQHYEYCYHSDYLTTCKTDDNNYLLLSEPNTCEQDTTYKLYKYGIVLENESDIHDTIYNSVLLDDLTIVTLV